MPSLTSLCKRIFGVEERRLESYRELDALAQPAASIQNNRLANAIVRSEWKVAAYCLDNGADPNVLLDFPMGGFSASDTNTAGLDVAYYLGTAHRMHALTVPVYDNDVEHIEWLVKRGSDVNGMSNVNIFPTGFTPLMLAAALNRKDAIRALMRLGADPYLKTPGSFARDSFEIAHRMGYTEAIKIMHKEYQAAATPAQAVPTSTPQPAPAPTKKPRAHDLLKAIVARKRRASRKNSSIPG